MTSTNVSNEIKLRVTKKAARKVIIKKITASLSILIVGLVALYGVFAALAMRAVFTGNVGVQFVKDPIYTGGTIPAGKTILFDNKKVEHTAMGNLKSAFTFHDEAFLATVEAGPTGAITKTENGVKIDNGEEIVGDIQFGKKKDPKFLVKEYLVRCISESFCEKDKLYIVSENNVLGVPIKEVKEG